MLVKKRSGAVSKKDTAQQLWKNLLWEKVFFQSTNFLLDPILKGNGCNVTFCLEQIEV